MQLLRFSLCTVFIADLYIPNTTFVSVSRMTKRSLKILKKCSEDKEATAGAQACEDLLEAACSVWGSLLNYSLSPGRPQGDL